MQPQTLGIIIGGLIPGVLFGFSNVIVKYATSKGIALPLYLIVTGLAVVLVGVVLLFIVPERHVSVQGGIAGFVGGAIWASGMSLIVFALERYSASISVLTPLFNLNTLVAVVLGLWIFSEWKTVSISQLFLGAVCIAVGGTLVARA
ncbi:MAG: hypothetical protein KC680_02550 [Candidatus Peregrinibacteria bacterium]|nr:hypothetical protein [Candidatus Peregrinibacteria bacterium]MCB9808291.1 hypothetical protein [Candidatus Peribacteria bacterium]